MTYTPVYTSLAAVKSSLGITDTDRDTALLAAIQAAEENIDATCGRKFWLDPTPSQRLFDLRWSVQTHPDGDLLQVDDIGVWTGTVVEWGSPIANSWVDCTQFILPDPVNSNLATDPRPVTALIYVGMVFPRGVGYRVRVTAQWGWPGVPASVVQAATLVASRLFKRHESPEGILASADWGAVRVMSRDPDVSSLLSPLCRAGGFA